MRGRLNPPPTDGDVAGHRRWGTVRGGQNHPTRWLRRGCDPGLLRRYVRQGLPVSFAPLPTLLLPSSYPHVVIPSSFPFFLFSFFAFCCFYLGGASNQLNHRCSSCGNCKKQCKRDVKISGVIAKNGKWLAGANSNYGDTVVIKKTCTQNVKKICSSFMGNTNGKEPVELTTGPDEKVCLYNTSDISSNC